MKHLRTRTKIAVAVAATAAITVPSTALADGLFPADPTEAVTVVPAGQADPFLASGAAIGKNASLYRTSGLGPAGTNQGAPNGSEERYIPTDVFPDGELPDGVTLTEAQGINALTRIGQNLAEVGLSFADVITMRVYLQNPEGEERMDYHGFNRAYRQFFANVNLETGETIPQAVGSGEPGPPMVVNPTRPSRLALEVENLPVAGWLVEIEVEAAMPAK